MAPVRRAKGMVQVVGAVAALVTALAAPSAASAATEVGNDCVAMGGSSNHSFVQLTRGAGGLPPTVPSPGVVTRWRVTSGIEPTVTHRLRVYRATGAPNTFTTVGESATEPISTGANSFPTRIPVQAGDRFGAYGSPPPFGAPLICITSDPANSMGIVMGDTPVGSTSTFVPVGSGYLVAVAATVEPDADNDGFGDETQDQCPQSAAGQVACPVTVLDSFALPKKGRVVVLVATSTTASVTVTGTANFARGKARSSAQAKLAKLTKVVEAGQLGRFSLNLPASLRSALRALPKGKSITLKLTATAPNIAGPATTDRARVKLRG